MNQLTLLTGAPGSGKSTVEKILKAFFKENIRDKPIVSEGTGPHLNEAVFWYILGREIKYYYRVPESALAMRRNHHTEEFFFNSLPKEVQRRKDLLELLFNRNDKGKELKKSGLIDLFEKYRLESPPGFLHITDDEFLGDILVPGVLLRLPYNSKEDTRGRLQTIIEDGAISVEGLRMLIQSVVLQGGYGIAEFPVGLYSKDALPQVDRSSDTQLERTLDILSLRNSPLDEVSIVEVGGVSSKERRRRVEERYKAGTGISKEMYDIGFETRGKWETEETLEEYLHLSEKTKVELIARGAKIYSINNGEGVTQDDLREQAIKVALGILNSYHEGFTSGTLDSRRNQISSHFREQSQLNMLREAFRFQSARGIEAEWSPPYLYGKERIA